MCICLKLILRIFFASKSTRSSLALVPKLCQSFVLVSVFVFVFALVLALKPIREDSAYCSLAPEPKLLQPSDFRSPDQLLLLHQLIITVTESQIGHWLSFHGHCWLLTIISLLGAPYGSDFPDNPGWQDAPAPPSSALCGKLPPSLPAHNICPPCLCKTGQGGNMLSPPTMLIESRMALPKCQTHQFRHHHNLNLKRLSVPPLTQLSNSGRDWVQPESGFPPWPHSLGSLKVGK